MTSRTGEPAAPKLVWHRPGSAPVEYSLREDRPMSVGREAPNLIALDSGYVSKAHAIVRFTQGQWVVEDLVSANGTRLNGRDVRRAVLAPGDEIEFGDQRVTFVSPSHSAGRTRGPLTKNARLALAAFGTAFVMVAVLTLFVIIGGGREGTKVQSGQTKKPTTVAQPAESVPVGSNPAMIGRVLRYAESAGIDPVQALFDQAMLELRAGRLRESLQLLDELLRRDPRHTLARGRFEQIGSERHEAVLSHSQEAVRDEQALRFADAALEWERVALLTADSDPRHDAALKNAEAARRRAGAASAGQPHAGR